MLYAAFASLAFNLALEFTIAQAGIKRAFQKRPIAFAVDNLITALLGAVTGISDQYSSLSQNNSKAADLLLMR